MNYMTVKNTLIL